MKIFPVLAAALLGLATASDAGFLRDVPGKVLPALKKQTTLDENVIAKGLKEALAVGTERAVKEVAKPDGYFANERIKILLPQSLQRAADLLGRVGYQAQVDELVLGMNRAAEKAAPQAAKFFGDAIRQMTVQDAKGIFSGGDTAATTFFEKKTRTQLFEAFRPVVQERLGQVGGSAAYGKVMEAYQAIPFAAMAGFPSVDLDTYVTNKALDGLFLKVGEEEKKIRKDPAAQTTQLLRKVFGIR